MPDARRADRVVVACTAGPEPVVSASRASATAATEVVAVVLGFGDGEPLEWQRQAALDAGAARVHVLDVRDEFARDYVLPALRANVLGDEEVEAALRRAIVTRMLADIAHFERATPIAPLTANVAPSAPSRHPVASTAAHVAIAFVGGVPTSLNAVPVTIADVFDVLAAITREHGVERAQMHAVVQAASRMLQDAVDPQELAALRGTLRATYADLVTHDRWQSPARDALDAFFAKASEHVTGAVRVKFENGGWTPVRVSLGSGPIQ